MLQDCDRIDRFPWLRLLSIQRYFLKSETDRYACVQRTDTHFCFIESRVVKYLISSCDINNHKNSGIIPLVSEQARVYPRNYLDHLHCGLRRTRSSHVSVCPRYSSNNLSWIFSLVIALTFFLSLLFETCNKHFYSYL